MAYNIKKFRLIIAATVFILVAGGLLSLWPGNEELQQPISFNHKKHTQNNVPCTYCHRYYQTSRTAGIPGKAVCRTCHEDVIYLTAEKEKIRNYLSGPSPIPWQQVYRAASHVFFSHRLHVVSGGLACENCHGKVAEMDQPLTEQTVPLKMQTCISCHEKVSSIDNPYECIRCHR